MDDPVGSGKPSSPSSASTTSFQGSDSERSEGFSEGEINKITWPRLPHLEIEAGSLVGCDAEGQDRGSMLASASGAGFAAWNGVGWQAHNKVDEPKADTEDVTERTVVFFDWDDTLLPTSAACKDGWSGTPPAGSAEALERHALLVRELLHETKKLGRVGIVTLSQRPWVQFSADHYLPGVDWKQEFETLEIPIVYAREALTGNSKKLALSQEGVNLFVACKSKAMSKVLRKLNLQGKGRLNMISVGDSPIEAEAAREVAWSEASSPGGEELQCNCKTVLLREEPSTVEELSAELRELQVWLQEMTAHKDDFDMPLADVNGANSPLRKDRPEGFSFGVV